MSKLPKISDAEWELMEIIWARAPITGSDVAQLVCDKHNWHLRTVKTMLRRLTQKGALVYKKNKKTFLYSPAIDRNEYIRQISKNFIGRIFQGKDSLALTHFVEASDLDDTEIKKLQALLASKQSK